MENAICNKYGISEVYKRSAKDSRYLEEVYFNGYTVIPNTIDEDSVCQIATLIDQFYESQLSELKDSEIVKAINDTDIVRCPLAYSEVFVELAKTPGLIRLVKEVLGDNLVLIMQNAIINRPTDVNYQTSWHRDLNYQHWTSSKPLALSALFVIDPFTIETGCTHVLPGSHLRQEFPSDDFVLKYERPITASAGSMIILDAMLYHRAGLNKSMQVRRAVNHVIGLPFMCQQINIPIAVAKNLAIDDFSSSYFGYRWNPAQSAKSWRERKHSGSL